MGLAFADITLENPREASLKPIAVRALADSGAVLLCIPEHIATQLKLEKLYDREVTTADGRQQLVPYVGPVHVRFKNRGCMVGALMMGDEVLLGAVPMQDMDLVVFPREQRIDVNPANPNFAHAKVKHT